ncbi:MULTISPECIES: hypothetical protein [unclassified Yoonia]|uniref:hypothetical protein n=1 Tax=unclassified Yoonia TaxID=2629118 RepID=UPI003727BDA3
MFRIKTTLACLVAIGSAGFAFADTSYFQLDHTIEAGDQIDLGTVRADDGGTLELYSFHCGTKGELLATESLLPGVNENVRMDVGLGAPSEVLAVINKDGQELAYQIFTLR